MALTLHRQTRPSQAALEALYEGLVAQSRAPELYREGGVADTVEGRFECLTLHVILLLARLGRGDQTARRLGQDLFDLYLSALDGANREMGVGDLAMGKRMRALGGVYYERSRAYCAALESLPDEAPLRALMSCTLLDGAQQGNPALLAAYVARCHGALERTSIEAIFANQAPWPSL